MSLTLFRNIHDQLTTHEKDTIVPMIIDTLAFKSASQALTAKHISNWLKACGENTSEIRVRKLISYIVGVNVRRGVCYDLEDKVVIGCGNGYYVTNSIEDVDKQIESLQDRIDNMSFRIDALKAQRENLKHKRA